MFCFVFIIHNGWKLGEVRSRKLAILQGGCILSQTCQKISGIPSPANQMHVNRECPTQKYHFPMQFLNWKSIKVMVASTVVMYNLVLNDLNMLFTMLSWHNWHMFFELHVRGGICVQPTCSSFSACLTRVWNASQILSVPWPGGSRISFCIAIFIKEMTSNSIWFSIAYGSALQHMKFHHKSDSAQFDDNYSCNTHAVSAKSKCKW